MEHTIVEEAPSAIIDSRNEPVKQKRKRSAVDPAEDIKSGTMSQSLITEATPSTLCDQGKVHKSKRRKIAKKLRESISNAGSNCVPEGLSLSHPDREVTGCSNALGSSSVCRLSEGGNSETATCAALKTEAAPSTVCTQSQETQKHKLRRKTKGKMNKSILIADSNLKHDREVMESVVTGYSNDLGSSSVIRPSEGGNSDAATCASLKTEAAPSTIWTQIQGQKATKRRNKRKKYVLNADRNFKPDREVTDGVVTGYSNALGINSVIRPSEGGNSDTATCASLKTEAAPSTICTQSQDLKAKKKKKKRKTNKSILIADSTLKPDREVMDGVVTGNSNALVSSSVIRPSEGGNSDTATCASLKTEAAASTICTQSQDQKAKKKRRKRNKSVSDADNNWKPGNICSQKGSHFGGDLSILHTSDACTQANAKVLNQKRKKKDKSGPTHHDRELSEGKVIVQSNPIGNDNSFPKKIRSSIFNVDTCFHYKRTTDESKKIQSSIFNVDTSFQDRKIDDVISNAQSKFGPEQKDVILPTTIVKAAGRSNRKLLILDLNGLLADVCSFPTPGFEPDTRVSGKAVYKRPFCDDFLQFCFETFDVGVWSSRMRRNVDSVVHCLMGDTRSRLIFCWDAHHCTQTGCQTVGNRQKPLVLKELTKLWEMAFPGLPWKKGAYDESNTLLIDDSPYKALRNPPYTAIFPSSYVHTDIKDNSLGPDGDLRLYLTRLATADNVQEFVAANPFGQRPITNSDPSWIFYSAIQNNNCRS